MQHLSEGTEVAGCQRDSMRDPAYQEDEMYALLATNGMLVKRPMFIGDDFVLVGFKETEWEKALK